MAIQVAPDIEARLRERDDDRKAALEKKRALKEKGQRPEESYEYFAQQFAEKKAAILKLLESSEGLPQNKLHPHFDTISLECLSLQKYVSDCTVFLKPYVLQTYQQQIANIKEEVNTKQNQLIPKKKFAFKSRKKVTEKPQTGGSTNESSSAVVASLVAKKSVGFTDRTHEKLEMIDGELKNQDVNLAKLSHCEVRLCGVLNTLHMTTLDSCTILCGPVSSSVFVDECRNCTFVVACQQLRVHTTTHSSFYAHITSRSIIEDCSTVTFAPYSWSYPGLSDHFQISGFNWETNNWNKVDDFNWLASSDPSPNWSTLPEQDRTVFT